MCVRPGHSLQGKLHLPPTMGILMSQISRALIDELFLRSIVIANLFWRLLDKPMLDFPESSLKYFLYIKLNTRYITV